MQESESEVNNEMDLYWVDEKDLRIIKIICYTSIAGTALVVVSLGVILGWLLLGG
tara:strand:- start:28 stop:192 length:165 start_codon:yes stop_codon:yes gene_type:complete